MDEILAIDQGTTSSRAILYGADLAVRAAAQAEFPQHFPAPGQVEHDPEDLWRSTLETARQAAGAGTRIAAIGITNQRETTLLWDRASGRALGPAIVWQDRRTADACAALAAEGVGPLVTARTGLLLDPYFSATKLAWLLDTIPGAREAAQAGRLAFGTVDSFLLWRLTEGRVHATDATNAARTMLYDIHRGAWDPDLLRIFRIPEAVLPEVRDCDADFGTTALLGGQIAIRGMAGDQQAAAMGQACFAPGMMKATYGTGCFALLNTGETAVPSRHRLLTTIAARLGGRTSYALEGSIFVAGAVVQWLRDALGVVASARETGALAAAADPAHTPVLVPAFTGLGAPWWEAGARGAAFGMSRATGRAELARAALQAVAFQTADLWAAMRADWPGAEAPVLRVDGGMAASDWTMQAISDALGAEVARPEGLETTALGAAWVAGQAAGLCPGPRDMAARWRPERVFRPQIDPQARAAAQDRWRRAVEATIAFG